MAYDVGDISDVKDHHYNALGAIYAVATQRKGCEEEERGANDNHADVDHRDTPHSEGCEC